MLENLEARPGMIGVHSVVRCRAINNDLHCHYRRKLYDILS
jgi:hypothetical protein